MSHPPTNTPQPTFTECFVFGAICIGTAIAIILYGASK